MYTCTGSLSDAVPISSLFFFNDTATTEIYTLSLHDALPISFRLIPGRHRLNLHASYGEFGSRRVERDELGSEHFASWLGWARTRGLGLGFNPTCFCHPLAADGWTLAHPDRAIRRFWIEHCRRCREIGAGFGKT